MRTVPLPPAPPPLTQPHADADAPASARSDRSNRPAPSRTAAILLGGAVTFLWATSWIIIKLGLANEELEPIGFAGLRYGLASIILLAVAAPRLAKVRPWRSDRSLLLGAVAYGVVLYGFSQAGQFIALDELPAATVTLFASVSPVLVAAIALRTRHEAPTSRQLAGIAILLVGIGAFFGFSVPPATSWLGLTAALVLAVSTAVSALLGRTVAVQAERGLGGALGMVALSMPAGAVFLLVLGLTVEGPPTVSATAWLYVAWMAIVNTALGFTIWTHTMRTLTATESTALARLTTVQIAVLAWVVLGESLSLLEVVGLALTLAGVLVVQLASPFRVRPSDVPTA